MSNQNPGKSHVHVALEALLNADQQGQLQPPLSPAMKYATFEVIDRHNRMNSYGHATFPEIAGSLILQTIQDEAVKAEK